MNKLDKPDRNLNVQKGKRMKMPQGRACSDRVCKHKKTVVTNL